jgi:hypothetical protein
MAIGFQWSLMAVWVQAMVDATVVGVDVNNCKHKIHYSSGEVVDVPLKGPNQQGNALLWTSQAAACLRPQTQLKHCPGMINGELHACISLHQSECTHAHSLVLAALHNIRKIAERSNDELFRSVFGSTIALPSSNPVAIGMLLKGLTSKIGVLMWHHGESLSHVSPLL